MLTLISPSKSQDFITPVQTPTTTQPVFKNEISQLIQICRQLNEHDIAKLMRISPKLARLNYERFQTFDIDTYHHSNAKPALFAFQGDVYKGLDANTLEADDLVFAQNCLAMISGLYGLLRPLDLMQPYRLEMKTILRNDAGKNLYAFWGSTLSEQLNQWLASHKTNTIINLASNEYWHAIDTNTLQAEIINIDFKEKKDDTYKTIGIHAKRARGLMARHIIRHRLTDPSALRCFTEAGYQLNDALSQPKHLVFTR